MTEIVTSSKDDLAEAIRRLVDQLAQRQQRIEEGRRSPRYPLNLPVAICLQNQRGTITDEAMAWASDLSCHGIQLISNRPLLTNNGTLVDFRPAIGRPCYVPVRLVHTRRLISGIHLTGAEFLFDRA